MEGASRRDAIQNQNADVVLSTIAKLTINETDETMVKLFTFRDYIPNQKAKGSLPKDGMSCPSASLRKLRMNELDETMRIRKLEIFNGGGVIPTKWSGDRS